MYSCRCGYEFCYLCTSKWKSCECDNFTEEHLLERVNEIVDRQPPANDAARVARVLQVRQQVMEHHHCMHFHVEKIYGPHNCQNCHQMMREHILQCYQCHLRACFRCYHHRL